MPRVTRRSSASRRSPDLASIWTEPPARRPSVTRERLVQEALLLLDELGFDGLTMRRLAERLGVQAASLYNHVRDKEQLLTLLADAITGEIREPPRRRPWREQLLALARDYRRVLLAHRDAARVLIASPPIGPKRLRCIELVLGVLHAAGFGDRDLADAAWVINTYIPGFVLDETQAIPNSTSDEISLEQTRAQVEAWFKSLPPEQYPTVVRLAAHLVEVDMDRRFDFGLRALLDGFEVQLTRRSSRRRKASALMRK